MHWSFDAKGSGSMLTDCPKPLPLHRNILKCQHILNPHEALKAVKATPKNQRQNPQPEKPYNAPEAHG